MFSEICNDQISSQGAQKGNGIIYEFYCDSYNNEIRSWEQDKKENCIFCFSEIFQNLQIAAASPKSIIGEPQQT